MELAGSLVVELYSLSHKFWEIYMRFQEFTVKINAVLIDLQASASFTVQVIWDKL